MPNVCVQCFSDTELVGFIRSQSNLDQCHFCDRMNVECLPIEELYDFFDELLENFNRNVNGLPLITLIQGNWTLFSSNNHAIKILNFVISENGKDFNSANDLVDFSDEILKNVNYWDILKNQLIRERRYLTDIDFLVYDLGWDGFFRSQDLLSKNEILYRGRIHHQTLQDAFSNEEMFSPSWDKSTAGRANPLGIPYLYLCDNVETIFYEIRASYQDEVSIGSFRLKEELTTEVFISDFTKGSTIFHPSEVSFKIKSTLLKQKISRDLSKPMRRYDSELDYIPTQFICEFIKMYTGVQGIKFKSSLHNGTNIVIFNERILTCFNVTLKKVKRLKFFF